MLADCGFSITEFVGMIQARLHIPTFTKGEDQLSTMEIDETRTIIANARICVEQVIRQNNYSILQSTLPIDFITKQVGEEYMHLLLIISLMFVVHYVTFVILLYQLSNVSDSSKTFVVQSSSQCLGSV